MLNWAHDNNKTVREYVPDVPPRRGALGEAIDKTEPSEESSLPLLAPATRTFGSDCRRCFPETMLGPTSRQLLESDAAPYFLWDTQQTVAEVRRIMPAPVSLERDELLVRLLREANSRDVWLFASWEQKDDAWPRIVHRLGRSRPVWELIRERHLYHVRQAS